MRLKKEEQLFFGCKIDSKLREALANAKPGDRKYFDDPNSEFLRLCTFDEERWIGKIMRGGLGVNDVEDVQRNVISILRRIAPNVRATSASIKIFAVEEAPVDTSLTAEPKAEADEEIGGPYIEY